MFFIPEFDFSMASKDLYSLADGWINTLPVSASLSVAGGTASSISTSRFGSLSNFARLGSALLIYGESPISISSAVYISTISI